MSESSCSADSHLELDPSRPTDRCHVASSLKPLSSRQQHRHRRFVKCLRLTLAATALAVISPVCLSFLAVTRDERGIPFLIPF